MASIPRAVVGRLRLANLSASLKRLGIVAAATVAGGALWAFSAGEPVAAGMPRCSFAIEPTILQEEGDAHQADGRLLQYWDVAQPEVLWSHDAESTRPYRRFLFQVRQIGFPTDPIAALHASPSINNGIVLEARADWIRTANCLEKMLMGLQNDRISIRKDPTEFVSFVLNRSDTEQVRVYFYSVNRNGIGAMTPLTRIVDADLLDGWQIRFVLHNHAFHKSNAALNGILAPSVPDADFDINLAKSHRLPEARITNGIDTVVIPAAAFHRFQLE